MQRVRATNSVESRERAMRGLHMAYWGDQRGLAEDLLKTPNDTAGLEFILFVALLNSPAVFKGRTVGELR